MSFYRSIFRPDLFAGQVYLVTGGGTGIGRTIAFELASLGAHVVVAARKEERLQQVVDAIQKDGGSASFHTVNIRDEDSIAAMFDAILAEHGTLHGLVNNAGGQFPSPAQFISKKGWHAVVETNLTGTFLVSKEAYNRVFGDHGGAVVNIVAEMWRGFPGMAHTGAARAGVVNLTKTLAVEWAHAGVRVNSVAPGTIAGHGLTQYDEGIQEMLSQIQKDVPMKRLGTESEISAAVTFLLSPAASYISGETMRVDGASSLWIKTWEVPEHNHFPPFEGWPEDPSNKEE